MNRWIASWAPFVLLFATSCGGDDEEPGYEWKCYARDDYGTCECYEVAVGSKADLGQSTATDVDECDGYESCKSYYDTLREQGRCDCGDADFEPSPSQRRDTRPVDSCPSN